MFQREIKIYKLLPKLGYIFHSLDDDEVYSDYLYTQDKTNYGSWEEIINKEWDGLGGSDNPILLEIGEDLIPNAYYSYNNKIYVYMGIYTKVTSGNLPSDNEDENFDLGWAEIWD